MKHLTIINLIKNNKWLIITYIIPIFGMLAYGYFLINCYIPFFSPDTIQYFHAANLLAEGELPLSQMPVDIPLGYPLWLNLLNGISLRFINLLQIIILFTGVYYLINQFRNYNKFIQLAASIGLTIYLLDPLIIKQSFNFYPDGWYNILLIYLVSALLSYIHNQKMQNLYLIVFFSMLIAFTRSNGIYIYFLFAFLLFLSPKKNRLKIILATVISLLTLSGANLALKGYFFPTDYNRLKNVYSRTFDDKEGCLRNQKLKNVKLQSKKEMLKIYLFSNSEERPSFYYSLVPMAYEWYNHTIAQFKKKAEKNNAYKYLNSPENKSLSIYKTIQEGIAVKSNITQQPLKYNIRFENRAKNLIPFVIQVFYKLFFVIFLKYKILSAIFYASFCIALYRAFKERTMQWWGVVMLSFVHIFSIFVLIFAHGRVQIRYINVTEFIIYLVPILSIYLLVKEYRKKKNSNAPQ